MKNERICVVLIIFSFDIEFVGGGISRFVVSLSQELDINQFQIVVCGLWNRGTDVEEKRIQALNEAGIQAFTCASWDEKHPYRAFKEAYCHLRSVIKSYQLGILHSHSLFGDIAALLLKFERKTPIIVRTLHNELRTEWNRRPLRRLILTNLLYPLVFDTEIGVSQYIASNLDQRWFARRLGRRALVIHNALDFDRFARVDHDRGKIRRNLGIPTDVYLVGSVGRLTAQKGYDVLLESIAQVVKIFTNTYFVIIGDGENAAALKKQALDLGITDRVIFTGPRSDIEEVLYAMDLFVSSSRWEGLSTVLMEAMVVGVPIVATDIPGNRELLQPGISAWFVPVDNAEALAEGIIEAYQKPDLSREFAIQGRQRVQSFRIDHIAKLHEQLYHRLINCRNIDR